MRVLIVSQYFHPENFRINQLGSALKAGGHDVVVVTGLPNYPQGQFFKGYGWSGPWRETVDGLDVIRVPLFPRGRGRGWELILNYLSFVFFAIFLGLPRLRGRFDVCVAWCSSPITIAIPAIVHRAFRGTPVAIWVQDLWPETFFAVTKSESGLLARLLKALVTWIYRHVDQIWMQSPAYEKSVLAHGGRTEQMHFVPNWAEDLYDCETWSGVEPDRVPPNSLVFAGNLGRAQGLETLLEAAQITARETPEAHWVFVGDGVLKDWLREEVERRRLTSHVTFLPRRLPSEMPKILKAATAVLVTLGDDQVYAMTIPSKVQSCMAAGRPVIGTLSGEPARVIQEAGCGFCVPPQDPAKLAATIKSFLMLPEEERARLGASGHAYYRSHFTQNYVLSLTERLLNRMRRK